MPLFTPDASRAYEKAVKEATEAHDSGDKARYQEASARATEIFYDPNSEA